MCIHYCWPKAPGQNQRDGQQVVGAKQLSLNALGTALILETKVSKLPDFEGLAIFAKVVQARSFVGAATELRLSKATVSKAVGRIEIKFGTRLFNRSARRLAL